MASGIGTDAARPAERVEFVDKDDGGRLLVGLLEQVAHARSTYADEHLDEFRARDRKERHLRFTGDRLGQQRLAGAGRAHQQHALRHAATEPAVVCRLFRKSTTSRSSSLASSTPATSWNVTPVSAS